MCRDAVIIKKGLPATCLAELPDSSIIGKHRSGDRSDANPLSQM